MMRSSPMAGDRPRPTRAASWSRRLLRRLLLARKPVKAAAEMVAAVIKVFHWSETFRRRFMVIERIWQKWPRGPVDLFRKSTISPHDFRRRKALRQVQYPTMKADSTARARGLAVLEGRQDGMAKHKHRYAWIRRQEDAEWELQPDGTVTKTVRGMQDVFYCTGCLDVQLRTIQQEKWVVPPGAHQPSRAPGSGGIILREIRDMTPHELAMWLWQEHRDDPLVQQMLAIQPRTESFASVLLTGYEGWSDLLAWASSMSQIEEVIIDLREIAAGHQVSGHGP